MKDVSAATLAHFAQATTQIAELWKVVRRDLTVWGWTDHDDDVVIDGVTYRASEGLMPSAAHSTDQLQVDTLDVTVFMDVSTEVEIAAGVWDGAEVVHAEYIWSSPPAALDSSVLVKRVGTLGEMTRKAQLLTVELRGLTDKLQTRIGRNYGPICPWYHAIWNGTTYTASVECGLSLTGRIHDGVVSALAPDAAREFFASGLALPAEYFTWGYLAATSGGNLGLVREVQRWENSLMSLLRPFPLAMEVGDTFRAVQGDDHSYLTCKDTLGNLNPPGGGGFGGFVFVPGQAAVYASPIRA